MLIKINRGRSGWLFPRFRYCFFVFLTFVPPKTSVQLIELRHFKFFVFAGHTGLEDDAEASDVTLIIVRLSLAHFRREIIRGAPGCASDTAMWAED
jgi:hypothetical protein